MRFDGLLKVIGALSILSAAAPALAADVSIDAEEARAAEGTPTYRWVVSGAGVLSADIQAREDAARLARENPGAGPTRSSRVVHRSHPGAPTAPFHPSHH